MSRQMRDNVTATKEPYSPTEPSTFETTSPECLIFNHGKWEGSEKPAGDKLGQHWSHRKHSTTKSNRILNGGTIFNLSNSYLQKTQYKLKVKNDVRRGVAPGVICDSADTIQPATKTRQGDSGWKTLLNCNGFPCLGLEINAAEMCFLFMPSMINWWKIYGILYL